MSARNPAQAPEWLAEIVECANAGQARRTYRVEGLELSVTGAEPACLDLTEESLEPLDTTSRGTAQRRLSLRIGYSDGPFRQVAREIADGRLTVAPLRAARDHHIILATLDDERQLCFRPSQGILWLVDRVRGTVWMCVSSRTKRPAREAFSTVRNIIIGHLHDTGWYTFHAGAVRFNDSIHLVVGDGGAGKTSLVVALVSMGAAFIANERILLKPTTSGVRALPFPMGIGIGYGTALQHPGLRRAFHNPESLLIPQYRFDWQKIRAMPLREQWQMKRKIYLTAGELVDALKGGSTCNGGSIGGIFVPRLTRSGAAQMARLSNAQIERILWNNRIPPAKERHYPAWMPLGFGEAPETAAADIVSHLAGVAAQRVDFFDPGDLRQLHP